jgi:hypothetical protein
VDSLSDVLVEQRPVAVKKPFNVGIPNFSEQGNDFLVTTLTPYPTINPGLILGERSPQKSVACFYFTWNYHIALILR